MNITNVQYSILLLHFSDIFNEMYNLINFAYSKT